MKGRKSRTPSPRPSEGTQLARPRGRRARRRIRATHQNVRRTSYEYRRRHRGRRCAERRLAGVVQGCGECRKYFRNSRELFCVRASNDQVVVFRARSFASSLVRAHVYALPSKQCLNVARILSLIPRRACTISPRSSISSAIPASRMNTRTEASRGNEQPLKNEFSFPICTQLGGKMPKGLPLRGRATVIGRGPPAIAGVPVIVLSFHNGIPRASTPAAPVL